MKGGRLLCLVFGALVGAPAHADQGLAGPREIPKGQAALTRVDMLEARCREELMALALRTDIPWAVRRDARAAAARLPALRPQFDIPVGQAPTAAPPAPRPEDAATALSAALDRCRPVLRKGLPGAGAAPPP